MCSSRCLSIPACVLSRNVENYDVINCDEVFFAIVDPPWHEVTEKINK